MQSKRLIVVFSVVLTAFGLSGCERIKSKIMSEKNKNTKKVQSEVLATVGDEKIYVDDFVKKVRRERQFNPKLALDDATKKRMLDEMVDFELMYQYAVAKGYDRSKDVKRIFVNTIVRKEVRGEIKPTDAELEKYFNQNKPQFEEFNLREILIRIPRPSVENSTDADKTAATKEEKRKLAEEILAKLKKENGANFEALAKEYSEDFSAKKGGEVGFNTVDRFPPEFATIVPTLKNKGDMTDVVETRMGYIIVQLIERRPGDFNKLKPYIHSKYVSVMQQKKYDEYVAALKSKASITIFNDRVEAALKEFESKQNAPAPAPTPAVSAPAKAAA